MKIMLISGSRNPEGQTATAANALLKGAESAGFEMSRVFLPTRAIERCRQCDINGWGICRSEGRCVIEDDLASLMDEIRAADVIVFATPVYFSDLSESMRAFLDRLRRVCLHENGRIGIEGKRAVGICVAGGGGGGSYSCAKNLDFVLGTSKFDALDVIPVRRQNLAKTLPMLESLGRSLAE